MFNCGFFRKRIETDGITLFFAPLITRVILRSGDDLVVGAEVFSGPGLHFGHNVEEGTPGIIKGFEYNRDDKRLEAIVRFLGKGDLGVPLNHLISKQTGRCLIDS